MLLQLPVIYKWRPVIRGLVRLSEFPLYEAPLDLGDGIAVAYFLLFHHVVERHHELGG